MLILKNLTMCLQLNNEHQADIFYAKVSLWEYRLGYTVLLDSWDFFKWVKCLPNYIIAEYVLSLNTIHKEFLKLHVIINKLIPCTFEC